MATKGSEAGPKGPAVKSRPGKTKAAKTAVLQALAGDEASLSADAFHERARSWWDDFRRSRAGGRAVDEFEECGGSEQERLITLNRIAIACFNASIYDPETDPGELYRASVVEARREVKALAKCARQLANAAERDLLGFDWAVIKAEESGARLRSGDGGKIAMSELAHRFFRGLEHALEGRLPELHGGPWARRFTVGNLQSTKPIASKVPTETATMLAFELCFYLRMHTAGRATDSAQLGQLMPADGRPCMPLVAQFVNATLGTSHDGKSLGDRLRKQRDAGPMGLGDWPIIEELRRARRAAQRGGER